MAYKSKVLARADGGTGLSSPGTSGNILVSDGTNWTSAAPAGGLGYTLQILGGNTATITDSSFYFISSNNAMAVSGGGGSTSATINLKIPKAGTITSIYGAIIVTGTLGTTENIVIAVRLNDTIDTTITSLGQASSTTNAFSNSSMSVSVSAGDFVAVKLTTPAWATNPTNLFLSATIYVS